jgi:WD domain, G-beta repeat
MPPPRAPSRIEPLSFPVFGISWFVNPTPGGADGGGCSSIVAYCGGGGSARTGVHNSVVITEGGNEALPRQIPTGDQVGIALHIYQNPTTGNIWLIVAMGDTVQRYALPSCREAGTVHVRRKDPCNALAVDAMAEHLAVGCDSGVIKVYEISDDVFDNTGDLFTLQGHDKAVCALNFSARGQRLVSSAKDGTACIWKDGNRIGGLRCTVGGDAAAPPGAGPPNPRAARPAQVLVRGCAFGDLDGKVIYTVASGRRGDAYLARWIETEQRTFACNAKDVCSAHPVSAMNLAADGCVIALGTTDGSIVLWDTEKWKVIKMFKEIHDLPVTGIAARPYQMAIRGEEDGVQINVRSVSADNKMTCLTLQTRVPKKKKQPGSSRDDGGSSWFMKLMGWIVFLIKFYIVLLIFSPVVLEARQKCPLREQHNLVAVYECLLHKVVIAPANTPGVISPPY